MSNSTTSTTPATSTKKKNVLYVVGPLGCRKCYLNVGSEAEAMRRYLEDCPNHAAYENPINKIEFDDMFECYDVWA